MDINLSYPDFQWGINKVWYTDVLVNVFKYIEKMKIIIIIIIIITQ